MNTPNETRPFDRSIDPVLRLMLPVETARNVVEYRPDPMLRSRIEELAEKSTAGELTEAERAEYEDYVRGNNFVAILQAKARTILASAIRR